MTTHNENKRYIVQATADLSAQASRFRAVSINGALVAAATAAGASGQAIGILQSSARSGDLATYVYEGITKVVAGAAVSTLGFPVMVGSNGYIFAANSGFSHVGRALEVAASGDLFQAMVDFSNLPLWSGA
jgi:hypothetical protein